MLKQINHPRGFSASEQRWLEQLMGTFYLPEKYEQSIKKMDALQKLLPQKIRHEDKFFVAKGAFEPLLWPVQAGASDYWGIPKALYSPIVQESWLKENNEVALLSSTLLAARQRDPSRRRHFFIHPLDYSLQNGWQALVIEKSLGAHPWYFPLEKTFLSALGQTIGESKDSLIELVYEIDLGQTSLELSRRSGLELDTLIDVYKDSYRKIARRCLPADSDLLQKRIEENWLQLLR